MSGKKNVTVAVTYSIFLQTFGEPLNYLNRIPNFSEIVEEKQLADQIRNFQLEDVPDSNFSDGNFWGDWNQFIIEPVIKGKNRTLWQPMSADA